MVTPLIVQTLGGFPGRTTVVLVPTLIDTGEDVPQDPSVSASLTPVNIGGASYETYLRFSFSGLSDTITSLRVFYSGAGLPTGVSLKYKGVWTTNDPSKYTTPARAVSSIAVTSIPTSLPGSANVTISNSTATSVAGPFISDYLILQLQTTSAAAAAVLAIPLTLTYSLNSADTSLTFNVSTVLGVSSSVAPYLDLTGIFYDYVDLTGTIYDGGGLG